MDDNKNGEHDKLWPESIDMKVYNDHTVSTTTTLNSRGDQMTSLAASPSLSHQATEDNNNKSCEGSIKSNVNNLSNGNDNLIT